MKLTIKEISKIINGKIIGDSEITICRIANIENSKKVTSALFQTQSMKNSYILPKHLVL